MMQRSARGWHEGYRNASLERSVEFLLPQKTPPMCGDGQSEREIPAL
jgi:hypothetical protein